MEELLKKEEGLTAWRYKLNRILGRISGLLQGSKERAVLTSINGKVSWEPVEEREDEAVDSIPSMHVDGYLESSTLRVGGMAEFDCQVEVNGRLSGRTLSLSEELVLKGNGRTERVYASERGLAIGPVLVSPSVAELPSMITLGDNATIGATSKSVSIYGKACPVKLDTINGLAEFPYGIKTARIQLGTGDLDGSQYPGNAKSASRLEKSVSIFGLPFDGSESLSGRIENCTGIVLAKNSKVSFLHGIGAFGAVWLECIGDALALNGRFKPRSLNVETGHYAEWYPCSERMENGDVISLDFNSEHEMYAKVNSEKRHPLGVVTTDYAMCIGTQASDSYPVCIRGRVSAKVEGKVKKGDSLVAGSTDGTLRAMTSKDKAFEAWAIALEGSNEAKVKLMRIHII